MLEILADLFFFVAVCGFGMALEPLFKIRWHSPLERGLFEVALGLTSVILATMILALSGGLSPWVIRGLTASGLLLFGIKGLPRLRSFKVYSHPLTSHTRFLWIIPATLLLYAILNVFNSLVPPFGMDALTYHFYLPKVFIEQRRLTYLPIFFWGYPLGLELIALWMMLLRGAIAAQLVWCGLGIVMILTVISFCLRYFTIHVGYFAALIFYSMPLVTSASVYTFTDLGCALFLFLALYALWNWAQDRAPGHLFLAGVFCGTAQGIKFTAAAPNLFLFLLLVGISVYQRQPPSKILRNVLVFGTLGLLFSSPWWLKNTLFTGNPLWPLFADRLGSKDIDPERYRATYHYILHYLRAPYGHSLRDLLFFPWRFTFHLKHTEFAVSPAFLAFLPLLAFPNKERLPMTFVLLAAALFQIVFHFFSLMEPRFVIWALVLISIVCGVVIQEALGRSAGLSRIVKGSLAFLAAFCLMIPLGYLHHRLPFVMGRLDRETYLSQRFKSYPAFAYVNRTLREGDLLFSLDPQVFYCEKNVFIGAPELQHVIPYWSLKDETELLSILRQLGVTHVLYNRSLISGKKKPIWGKKFKKTWFLLRERHLQKEFSQNGVSVYRVVYGGIQ